VRLEEHALARDRAGEEFYDGPFKTVDGVSTGRGHAPPWNSCHLRVV